MAVLTIKGVSYTYPGQPNKALDTINLTIETGQLAVVSGASLSGKTSLCLLAAGLIPKHYPGTLEGEIELLGQQISQHPCHHLPRLIGFSMQNPYAQLSGTSLTVTQEVALSLENLGVDPQTMGIRIQRILQQLGIQDIAHRDPALLSGGQVQRLVLATTLVADTPMVILDEPTAQLDPEARKEVYRLALDLTRTGKSILMADKDLVLAAQYAHRLLIMDQGCIVLDGQPWKIAAHPDVEKLGLLPPRYTTAARIARNNGLWPTTAPLPAILDQAAKGFAP